jgi:hypothetical protein
MEERKNACRRGRMEEWIEEEKISELNSEYIDGVVTYQKS